MRPLLLLLLLGVTISAPAQSTPASRDADEVKATLVQMWAAIEAGDAERYATFVHPDFTQFGESDPYLAQGKWLCIHGRYTLGT